MGVIFVGGVHAVGKTTVCEEAARICAVPHYSASALIKNEKRTAIPERGKVVADIGGNQELLVRGTQRVLTESSGKLLLDGHFTLPNQAGEIERIEFEVFRLLSLDRLVVYHDDPGAIAERLTKRDGEERSVELIAYHQSEELLHAENVSRQLGVQLVLLDAFDMPGLVKVVG